MKWVSHTAIGAGYAVISGHTEPFALSALLVGSVLPDAADRFFSMGNQMLWEKIHRGLSHWWLLYVSLIFLIMFAEGGLTYFLYLLFIGCLLHIFADMLTRMGVPLVNPFKAGYGLKILTTGSLKEAAGVAGFIAALYVLNFLPMPLWISLTAASLTIMIVSAFKDKGEKKKDKKEIALEELSKIWKPERKEPQKPLSQPVQTAKQDIVFNHEEYTEFFQEHVARLPTASVEVIRDIMQILDINGDCPSVVKRSGEPDYPENSFDLLAKVPLWEHSLHVAVEILKTVDKPGAYAAQLLICAFGHDIGKIQSFEKALYSMGDHPKISLVVLNGITGFSELPYRNEVEQAILNHHRAGGGELADRLREADRNARKRELGESAKILMSSTKDMEGLDLCESVPANTNSKIFMKVKEPDSAMERIFFSEPETKEEKKPKEAADLDWVNIDELLKELDSKINVLKGDRFDAFSMKDGHVYFLTDVFWRVLKKLARAHEHDYILLGETDRKLRRNYIFTLVNLLREKNFVADGLMKNDYFTAPFIVTFKDGTQFKNAFYTPLLNEAFSDVSELESRKAGKLLDIISVKPKYSEEKE